MNFLSHFYFDIKTENPYMVLGTVLPDLLKNANKDWNAYPQKKEHLFVENENHIAILIGWKRHLLVDQLFHSSDFFFEHTKTLKQNIVNLLENSPVRPSFYAHIALELLLDHLLILKIDELVPRFYRKLDSVDMSEIYSFLAKLEITGVERFERFFNGFKKNRYLFSYNELENIGYALNRICMRIWPNGLAEETTEKIIVQLAVYKSVLQADFMRIFDAIETRLLQG